MKIIKEIVQIFDVFNEGILIIIRYELPQLGAMNFVMHDALGGGVTRTL